MTRRAPARAAVPARPRRVVLGLVAAAALVVAALPAGPVWAFKQGDMPDFVVSCPFSHRLPDDPIVYPGQPGASHLHDFFGNTSVDAASTYSQLRRSTT